MEYFFTHKENIPEGIGYRQFGWKHLTMLGLVFFVTAWITIIYRRAEEIQRIHIRRTIAVYLISADILKMIMLALDGIDVTYYLPLEICSFAAYAIVFDAFFPKKKFFSEMLVLLFLPGALMALLFPTTTPLPPINFFTIHQFSFHAMIIAYAFARFANGEIRITYPGMWKSVFKICAVAAFVGTVDVLFGRNFMFLRSPDGNPMLELISRVSGGGRFYIVGLIVFVIIVLHVFYLIFKGLEKLIVRRNAQDPDAGYN